MLVSGGVGVRAPVHPHHHVSDMHNPGRREVNDVATTTADAAMMPDEEGWHEIDVGLHLRMMSHPNRCGRQPDEIEHPSIVVALAGQQTQVLRLDPFS